jgi:hypothetical protein
MNKTLVGLLLALAATGAAAQQYNCKTKAGMAYSSDKPCSTLDGSTTDYSNPALRSSPTPAQPSVSYSTLRSGYTAAGRGEAPPWLRYMSASCSSLHDALRTAQGRGLKPETVATMRRDYERDCLENERQALLRASQESRDGAMQQRDSAIANAQQEKLSREQMALRAEQCAESRRILNTKKARPNLTDGEKAELAKFEENFKSRCSSSAG